MDYEWIEKTILEKKTDKKIRKNRKSMSKCRMWTKKTTSENEKLIQTKN